MNFKTKDDIIKSTQSNISPFRERHFNNGVKEGVDESFKSFDERIRFYKSHCIEETCSVYYGFKQLERMKENEPELFELWKKQESKTWNEWLFDYCFGDMIK